MGDSRIKARRVAGGKRLLARLIDLVVFTIGIVEPFAANA
jgi:hypothetical protein